ncbi:hypothetical protein EYZ11_003489 [Aspergillus tanneri]|uniref:Uncharacterized protein n=1 Tax=Aspergillus tanneri TaxID=1220188 RepID=A0A4S3JN43_9EURO|nr:hypothetical protein EYZ11_003489 [Aspergillus tanneri]
MTEEIGIYIHHGGTVGQTIRNRDRIRSEDEASALGAAKTPEFREVKVSWPAGPEAGQGAQLLRSNSGGHGDLIAFSSSVDR